MMAEVINLRKLIIPMLLIGLAGIGYINLADWSQSEPIQLRGIDMSHMMETSHYSVAFNGLALFLTFMIILLAGKFYQREEQHLSDYLAIIIFILSGTTVLFTFNNMAMLFLGIEIVSISLYIMAGSRKFDSRSNEAGFKYFIMGSFASGILLLGIALIYGSAGSFELRKISEYACQPQVQPMFHIGCLLMVMAMLFKVAAVPFHFWSPDVYEGSPSLVTALMSTLVKVSVFAAFYRLISAGFFGAMTQIETVLVVVTSATLLLGNLTALYQQNFKRMLAYSGISHAGYMLMAVLTLPGSSSSVLFYYACAYAIGSLGVFAIAIPVFTQGSELISAFNGLGKRSPILAAMLTMGMLSIAGIPPFAGFMAKYYLFSEAFHNGYGNLTLLAVITSVIAVYYYFRVLLAMYTREPAKDAGAIPVNGAYWTVIVICTSLSLLLGIFPGWFTGLL